MKDIIKGIIEDSKIDMLPLGDKITQYYVPSVLFFMWIASMFLELIGII